MKTISVDELPMSVIAREFVGDEHGGGEIVVIGAGSPHRFMNSGAGTLRQIDVNANSHFVTEWLEDAARA